MLLLTDHLLQTDYLASPAIALYRLDFLLKQVRIRPSCREVGVMSFLLLLSAALSCRSSCLVVQVCSRWHNAAFGHVPRAFQVAWEYHACHYRSNTAPVTTPAHKLQDVQARTFWLQHWPTRLMVPWEQFITVYMQFQHARGFEKGPPEAIEKNTMPHALSQYLNFTRMALLSCFFLLPSAVNASRIILCLLGGACSPHFFSFCREFF
jgi:hypothetical protein